jgi:hypothetical protein
LGLRGRGKRGVEKNWILKNFLILPLTRYHSGDAITNDTIDRVYRRYGEEDKREHGFGIKT